MNLRLVFRFSTVAIFALALVVLPSFFGPYSHYVLATVMIYAIVALSLNILIGLGGQISLGHASFWAIGAYGAAVFSTRYGMPLIPSVLMGGAFAAVGGAIVAMPALRVQGHYLAIATLGFSLVVQQILYEWDGVTGGRQGLSVDRPPLFGIDLSTDLAYYYVVLLFALVAAVAVRNFQRSLNGLSLGALRMSSIAAQSFGINRAHHIVTAFTLSAFMTGISGGLYAYLIGQLSTDSFSLSTSLNFLTMAVIGGVNSIGGAFLGGMFMALAPELLRPIKEGQTMVYGVILIAFMHFLPGGMAGIWAKLGKIMRRT